MNEDKMPLASLLILFYNQEKFVADAVKGALSQTYSNLEIILSDDCSTDNTFQAIREAVKDYDGPHKIVLNHNERNMGLVPHINKLLFDLACGGIICLNGGDDISLPNRVADTVDYLQSRPGLTAVTMSYDIIDKHGVKTDGLYLDSDKVYHLSDKWYLKTMDMMWGTTALAFRRSVAERFGPLNDDCPTEDSVLRFRSILSGDVLSSAIVGLKRRVHDTNMSHNLFRLKTEPIANQYQQDFDRISDTLPAGLRRMVENKISVYRKYRRIQEFLSHASGDGFFLRLRLLLLRYTHSLRTEFYLRSL